MERYISVERTRMVDEASYGHIPTPLTSSLLRFVLVYLIASLLSGIVSSIPLGVYLFTRTDFMQVVSDATNGTITNEVYLEKIDSILTNLPPVFSLVMLFCTVTSIAAAIIYCKLIEKRSIASMGIRKGNAFAEYMAGAGIGVIMYALTFLIALASGSVSIKLNPQGFMPIILLFLVGYIIQGASEELLVRGYLMVTVARDYKPWIAIIFSSTMFSVLHAFNVGVSILALVNIFLFGILMGVYVFKRGNIWGACAIHSFWNFAQGNIFGSFVSGNSATPSVFLMEYDPSRQLANGGIFGLEGGAAATIVLVIALGLCLLLKTKKSEVSILESPLNVA